MFVQIDGIYYPNKGDQLMLHSIIDVFEDTNHTLVFGQGKTYADPYDLRRYGIFQLAYLRRFKIRFDRFISERYLFSLGLVREYKIKLLLDSGGFQFGDQWEFMYSNAAVRNLEKYYGKYKKNGTKIIFLPQAFGPFYKNKSKKIFQTVAEFADLIIARDKISYQYAYSFINDKNRLKLYPDFTVLLTPGDINKQLKEISKNAVVIIPNSKMMTHTSKTISQNYFNFIVKLLKLLVLRKEKTIIINHEGNADSKLIKQILNKAQLNIPVMENLHARQIKASISMAKLLVSSRYHGLMNGLTQLIPSFTTAWSHKYQEIMQFYKLDDYLLDMQNINAALEKIISFLDRPENYPYEKHKEALNKHIELTKQMWNEIFSFANV